MSGVYELSGSIKKRERMAEDLLIFLFELYASGRRPNGDTLSDLIDDLSNTLNPSTLMLLEEMRIQVDHTGIPPHVYDVWINRN